LITRLNDEAGALVIFTSALKPNFNILKAQLKAL